MVTTVLKLLRRTVFKQTGKWNPVLDKKVKFAIELYWKSQFKKDFLEGTTTPAVKEKCYVLSMFPYPSGKLHMGHARVYTISDVLARYHRMLGKEVLHPMGWDAFGLPAENAAKSQGTRTDKWTYENIKSMREQLDSLGCEFNWKNELVTCDPDYYKWTQHLFLQLYHAGLVYQRKASVNCDPVDKTVLADEQVDAAGLSWRSGAKVTKRYLKQWFINMAPYIQPLYDELENLNSWNSEVVKIQQWWIGKPDGTHFLFRIRDASGAILEDSLSIHTSTPHKIFSKLFISIRRKHFLDVEHYHHRKNANGDIVLNVSAVHPFTNNDIPITISDSLPFPSDCDIYMGFPEEIEDKKFSQDNKLECAANPLPDILKGSSTKSTSENILRLAKTKNVGGYATNKKNKDWLVSRQRYWGTPIPIIHCPKCQAVPVPYNDLPVRLPDMSTIKSNVTEDDCKGTGISPLATNHDWVKTKCPKCGCDARREVDTMDTFVDSSWYYIRYLDVNNSEELVDKGKAKNWLPVNIYIGGKEHAVSHLYYARFIAKFLHSKGLLPCSEPFNVLLTQGFVMGQSYRIIGTGKYIPETQVEFSNCNAIEKFTGKSVTVEWEKMSKSKLNGVNTAHVLEEHGTDSARLFIMADVPAKSNRNWDPRSFDVMTKWQEKVYNVVTKYRSARSQECLPNEELESSEVNNALIRAKNEFVRDVTLNLMQTLQFNVCIWKMQTFTKVLHKQPQYVMRQSFLFEECLRTLVIVMAPFVPHLASEMWAGIQSVASVHKLKENVLEMPWPEVDDDFSLDVHVHLNFKERLFSIKLPKWQLNELNVKAAWQMIAQQDNDRMHSLIQDGRLKEAHLRIDKNIRAYLNVFTKEQKDEESDLKIKLKND